MCLRQTSLTLLAFYSDPHLDPDPFAESSPLDKIGLWKWLATASASGENKAKEKNWRVTLAEWVEVRGKETIEALTSERLPLFGYLWLHGWDGHH